VFSKFEDLLKILHRKGFLEFFDGFEDESFEVSFGAWVDVVETF
jgi:hypothetical protein